VHPDEHPDLPRPDGFAAGAFPSQPTSYRPRWWLHVLLFLLTFASTTIIGALFWGSLPPEVARLGLGALFSDPRFYLTGLEFSLPLLTILMCHELGHYFAARHHGLKVTPPFFIPFPIPFGGIGTLGAVIRIKDPITDKRQLLDVGAAGPIAVDYDTKDASHRTYVSEVRPDGVFLETAEAISVAEEIWLTFTQEQGGGSIMVSGRVASRSPSGIDVRFERLTPVQQKWIAALSEK